MPIWHTNLVKPGLARSDFFSFLHWRVIALPPRRVSTEGFRTCTRFQGASIRGSRQPTICCSFISARYHRKIRVSLYWDHDDFLAWILPVSLRSSICERKVLTAPAGHCTAGAGCAQSRCRLLRLLRPMCPREWTQHLARQ